jgi:hypothetical protein
MTQAIIDVAGPLGTPQGIQDQARALKSKPWENCEPSSWLCVSTTRAIRRRLRSAKFTLRFAMLPPKSMACSGSTARLVCDFA